MRTVVFSVATASGACIALLLTHERPLGCVGLAVLVALVFGLAAGLAGALGEDFSKRAKP